MEPTIKQLQDTIAQLNEALENWDYVVSQDGVPVQLPITKLSVHTSRGLCSAFFGDYPDWFIDKIWDTTFSHLLTLRVSPSVRITMELFPTSYRV